MTEGRNIRPKQKPFSVRPNEKHYERNNERVVERREARQSNPEWKRLATDKSGLESIRRRLNHFGTDPIAFGQCLHFIKEETLERLKNTKFGIHRMTIDSKPSTQFRPCQFYQSDQCRQTIYRFWQYPNFLVYISVLAEVHGRFVSSFPCKYTLLDRKLHSLPGSSHILVTSFLVFRHLLRLLDFLYDVFRLQAKMGKTK